MNTVVKLTARDGHSFDAYVARPEGAPRGGVVVVQEIFGVNQHIRAVADRFAAEGFLAVAPALFDRVQSGLELAYDEQSVQRGMGIAQKLKIDDAIRDVEAALLFAGEETHEPAAVVGFCYGGTLAWLSATRLHPAAAVGFYGGHIARFAEEKPQAPVMLHFGNHDKGIPAADVERVQASHPEVEFFWYDAGHAFNNDMRPSFDAKSSSDAMSRTLAFLALHVEGKSFSGA